MTAACARFALPRSWLGLTGAMQGRRLVFPEILEDMTIRKFAPKTQHDYVRRVKNFAAMVVV